MGRRGNFNLGQFQTLEATDSGPLQGNHASSPKSKPNRLSLATLIRSKSGRSLQSSTVSPQNDNSYSLGVNIVNAARSRGSQQSDTGSKLYKTKEKYNNAFVMAAAEEAPPTPKSDASSNIPRWSLIDLPPVTKNSKIRQGADSNPNHNSQRKGKKGRRETKGLSSDDQSLRFAEIKLLGHLDSAKKGEKNFGIFLPDSKSLRAWESFISLLALLSCILAPIEIGFQYDADIYESPTSSTSIRSVLRFIDVAFIFDLVVNFSTAYIGYDGHLVFDRKRIAIRYLKGWFLTDFIASVPLDVLFDSTKVSTNAFKLFKASRLMRLSKIIKVMREALDNHFYFVWTFRLARLILLMAVSLHWIICLFNVVLSTDASTYVNSVYSKTNIVDQVLAWEELYDINDESVVRNNITAIALGETKYLIPFSVKYGVLLYYVVIMFLGNDVYPTTLEEHVVAAVFAIFGAIMQAYILGEVSMLLVNLSFKSRKWQEKMDSINDAMKYMGINRRLQQRVRSYFEFSWEVHGGDYSHGWMWELSENLHAELLLSQHSAMIRKVPIFQEANPNYVKAIVMKLHLELYLPGDYVIECGSTGDSMFFITRGTVYCTDENESVIFSVMHEGSFFGEIALLHDSIRTANVRAETFCELNKLAKEDFTDVGLEFPHEAFNIVAIARQRELNTGGPQVEMTDDIDFSETTDNTSGDSPRIVGNVTAREGRKSNITSQFSRRSIAQSKSTRMISESETRVGPLDEVVEQPSAAALPRSVTSARLNRRHHVRIYGTVPNRRKTELLQNKKNPSGTVSPSTGTPGTEQDATSPDVYEGIHEELLQQRELLQQLLEKSASADNITRSSGVVGHTSTLLRTISDVTEEEVAALGAK